MTATLNIPRHIAIIMDGNGRWARNRGKERLYGHIQGVESVRTVLKAARSRGVEYLTLYVFSTENWGRPTDEVDGLMELLCRSIAEEVDSLIENGVRVIVVGDRSNVPEKVVRHIGHIETSTAHCTDITMILALNYGSREELTAAARKLAEKVADGAIKPEQITMDTLTRELYTADIPDPDLLIRTSGEQRLSNYLLWQLAYTELYFTDTLWPDFGAGELDRAIEVYSRRERRFGLVNEN